jgi:hypothetical protein
LDHGLACSLSSVNRERNDRRQRRSINIAFFVNKVVSRSQYIIESLWKQVYCRERGASQIRKFLEKRDLTRDLLAGKQAGRQAGEHALKVTEITQFGLRSKSHQHDFSACFSCLAENCPLINGP